MRDKFASVYEGKVTDTDNCDPVYTYRVRVSMDCKQVTVVFGATTEFTNRKTISALRSLADEIESECAQGKTQLDG